ncbi:MAG: ATP-binding protein [Actinomycetota bacterium]|nr:ATP-binding protein [Actinomycetota bacterium]
MRRRVLQATVAAVTVAVILLGFPLAFIGAQIVRQNELRELDQRANALARQVDTRIEREIDITEGLLELYVGGDRSLMASVFVITPENHQLSAGPTVTGQAIQASVRTEAGATVLLFVSRWDMLWVSAQVVLLVIAAAVVAFAAGIAMALWQANRLAAPLVYLASFAEMLGAGQVKPSVRRSGVEEIDQVALELSRSADRMAERLAVERQFASDASHQLRTPLTALSMRIEEIMLATESDEVREEARISLEQVERLADVVDDLLGRNRQAQGGTTQPVNVFDLAEQQLEEWEPTFDAAGRRLELEVEPDVEVLATPGALSQVLATLVENSLKHGAGTTWVRSRPSGPGDGTVLEVGDSGAGVPDELAPRIFERAVSGGSGTGLGLSLARDLVTADGGRLELAQRRPAVFAVFLAGVPRSLDPQVLLPKGSVLSSPHPPTPGTAQSPSD